jgi:hypothetical protein
MSPLLTGPGNIRKNVQELMNPIKSQTRKKAVATIARTRNISRKDAQFVQAKAIAISQGRKK